MAQNQQLGAPKLKALFLYGVLRWAIQTLSNCVSYDAVLPGQKNPGKDSSLPGFVFDRFGNAGYMLSRGKAHSGFNSKGLLEHIVCLSNGGTYCRG